LRLYVYAIGEFGYKYKFIKLSVITFQNFSGEQAQGQLQVESIVKPWFHVKIKLF